MTAPNKLLDCFLSRHGEASFDAPSDRLRPLTERGVKDTELCIAQYSAKLQGVGEIWVSDFLRAQQTAELYAKHLNVRVSEHSFLRPDTDPVRVVRHLSERKSDHGILLVAHMPLLGNLVSLLTEGHTYSPYGFHTSELVHLRGELLEAGLCKRMPLS